MGEKVGNNIHRYRKEQGLTQSQLAAKIGVTFQAISKWETGQTVPEISNISTLAHVLDVSVDALLGHSVVYDAQQRRYDSLYDGEGFYWGKAPTDLALKVLEHKPPKGYTRLLDAGCREGQNTLFFARNGYSVTGLDLSKSGIEKARRLVLGAGMHANIICASIVDFLPGDSYDVFFCDEILHLIPPHLRLDCLSRFMQHTSIGGTHFICVPVYKPFVPIKRPEKLYPWASGQLMQQYKDWEILECTETAPILLNGNSMPQVYNIVIARKPG